jgi:hypothetical protein
MLPFDIWARIAHLLSTEAKQKIQDVVNKAKSFKTSGVSGYTQHLEVHLAKQTFKILCTKFQDRFHIHLYREQPTTQLLGTITDHMLIYASRTPGNYIKGDDNALKFAMIVDPSVRFACLFMYVYDQSMFQTTFPQVSMQISGLHASASCIEI